VDTRAAISCALSSRNSTEITRRQHFDRHYVAGNVVLTTVVGVLIEVPVMLSVVKIVNRTSVRYETQPGVPSYEQCCPATGNGQKVLPSGV
jgi:hypothetical protein